MANKSKNRHEKKIVEETSFMTNAQMEKYVVPDGTLNH
jgi:hypothetical protein